MNDKELADKVVALDVGQKDSNAKFTPYFWSDHRYHGEYLDAELFVRDWRVAGACFEALDRTVHDMISLIQSAVLIEQRERNWPRAITEACVEELERVQTGLKQK